MTWRMSLPAVVASVLLTCLPMLGDYFTNDLLSASPRTSMVGNLINNSVLTPGQTGQAGAFVLLVLLVSLVPMLLVRPRHPRPARRCALMSRRISRAVGAQTRGGRRASCPASPSLYLLWSLLPVVVAVIFSFNAGKSRTAWQGFSMRWYYGDPIRSVWHDPSLHTALTHTLVLGSCHHRDHVPLGVAFALGIDRWRGRLPAGANFTMLLSFVLPEMLLAVALLFLAHRSRPRSTPAPRADHRPGDLPAVLSGGHRAGPAADHRQAVRGSRA